MKDPLYFTEKEWFEIAKAIDNEYIGKGPVGNGDTGKFRVGRAELGYTRMFTDAVDSACSIRVYWDIGDRIIKKITVNGEYTEGYQPIQPGTWKRVMEKISTFKTRSIAPLAQLV